MLILKTGK